MVVGMQRQPRSYGVLEGDIGDKAGLHPESHLKPLRGFVNGGM